MNVSVFAQIDFIPKVVAYNTAEPPPNVHRFFIKICHLASDISGFTLPRSAFAVLAYVFNLNQLCNRNLVFVSKIVIKFFKMH